MTASGVEARSIRLRGVVQGVGFRPFVFRIATAYRLAGWVANDAAGVEIHIEGPTDALDRFSRDLAEDLPSRARVSEMHVAVAACVGLDRFAIRNSERADGATAWIAPDLRVCDACIDELFDPRSRRHEHLYASCSECGPRYSMVTGLPYDRARTTMSAWAPCAACAREYADPADRRFHMQAIACRTCGPGYVLLVPQAPVQRPQYDDPRSARGADAIRATAQLLRDGAIVAIKGVGGYHVACDAFNRDAIDRLRERKYRKERPFALMVADDTVARRLVDLTSGGELLLRSDARPIVVAAARLDVPGVAPGGHTLGVMLPYTPLHHLLFGAAEAPRALVMTSGNRSSEPIVFEDDEAIDRLAGIADAFLIGERPIARPVDDSVVRDTPFGPTVLRRARGYAPGSVARLPTANPVLALGADLKNTVTLVVDGDAFVSQHLGDLDHLAARESFERTVHDLVSVYGVDSRTVVVAHDCHPEYVSSVLAAVFPCARRIAIQHHRAHVASVLAERGGAALERRVVGLAFDGTGYGDDGSIWGGEFFAGSAAEGLQRVGHLRGATLAGGDAAARYPVQAAAGYLARMEGLPVLEAAPFWFPPRYTQAVELLARGMRVFPTTSAGRLFDTVAALLGFTRAATFEGQAAMWVESLAAEGQPGDWPLVPWTAGQLDYRPALAAVIEERVAGVDVRDTARRFHRALARGIAGAAATLCEEHDADVVVLSGGVFQNARLVTDIVEALPHGLRVWTNRVVPPNDGGISLGQAALSVFAGEADAITAIRRS